MLGVDHNWRPTARWNVRTRLIGSDIEQSGETQRDTGATVWADYEMDHGWRQQWIAHAFRQRAADQRCRLSRAQQHELRALAGRIAASPICRRESRYASKDWRWRVSTDYNDHGELLNHQFRISRESRLRNGSYEYGQININSAGVDDLLTRGNGAVNLPPNFNSFFEYERPRNGNWGYEIEAEVFSGGLSGNDKIGYRLEVEPRYFVSDAFNIYVGLEVERTPDWLVWQAGQSDRQLRRTRRRT